MKTELIIYLAFIGLMTLLTMGAYYIDKRKAIKGTWRTKEKTLLLMSIFGGSLGGLIGLYVFRHKTKHFYFVLANFFGLALIMVGYYLIHVYVNVL